MTTQSIRKYEDAKIETIQFIADFLDLETVAINPDTKISDISNDSIQLFELIQAFEKRYGDNVTYEDIVKLYTVEDVILYTLKVSDKSNK